MKNIKLILFSMVAVLMFASCEDFLEEKLTADVSAGSYYTTAQGFEDAVKGTYTSLKSYWGQEMGCTMTAFGTDTYTNGADGSHKEINFYNNELNPNQTYMRNTWRVMYQGINQANAVIGRAEDIEGLSEEVKNLRIAEVRFLRALYYFTLVRTYGDAHLTLEETEGAEVESNRTPIADIYAQAIIPDLEFAAATLPVEQSDYGRPTKPAAEFLLAKVHLTRGWSSAAQSDDWQAALDYAETVLNDYNFALEDDFADIFALDNQLNSEVVWSIQNTTNQLINGNGNRGHLYFLMEYDKLPGMTRDTENGRPWKRFRPTQFTYDLWDRDIDSRYVKSFKHAFFANNEGGIPTDDQGNRLFEVGDTAIFMPGVEWTDEEVASKPYLVIRPSEYTQREYLTLAKHLDNTRPDRQWTQGSRDWMLMRITELYFVAAEAHLQLGNVDEATQLLNTIRRRGAWPGMEDQMEVTSADVDLDFLLDEKAREMVGECHRWFDLARTGKLVERVRLHNPDAASNIQDFHVLRPIPQEQIDKTTSDYPQNPGY